MWLLFYQLVSLFIYIAVSLASFPAGSPVRNLGRAVFSSRSSDSTAQ